MEHSSDYIGTPNELMLIAERDKLQRKLNKVQQRRDHYARLYYRTLAQLDDAKLELVQAKHKIQKFQQLITDTTLDTDSGISFSQQFVQPKPRPAFTRSLTFSQGDTPPIFRRQLSVPGACSMTSLSAFQPLKSTDRLAHSVVDHRKGGVHTPIKYKQPREISRSSNQMRYQQLNGLEMLDLLSLISSPECSVHSLEVASSQLGQSEAMSIFCADLTKNNSITSLSLPHNGIGKKSLAILLEAVQKCCQLKELLLRNNLIGVECVECIKSFLASTTLDSLVLTGNAIEEYSHLLSEQLPGDFSMEHSEGWESSEYSEVAAARSQRDLLCYVRVHPV